MTKQRLHYLFERYIHNLLTSDEEKEFMNGLDALNDNDADEILMQLWLDSGEPDAVPDAEGERRIQNILTRVNGAKQSVIFRIFGQYSWLKAAAVLLIMLSAGLWFSGQNPKVGQSVLAKNMHMEIRPGSNKAYLTIANGSRIALNDVKTGNVAVQSGIQVSKIKSGLLVYDQQDKLPAPNAEMQYNAINTPRGGQYQVVLADGTKAWLNAASSLKFPVAFNGSERTVEVTGEVYFEVAKDKTHPFIVKANDVNIRVLGTHFNVSAYADDGAVTTTLMEGSVKISKGPVTSLLKPGQQGIAINNKGNIILQDADIEAIEAWRKGLFIFHDEIITNVMKIMARWYDVDIVYEGDVRNKEFGGSTSKNKSIITLLENMRLTGAIQYRIVGRRIIVMN